MRKMRKPPVGARPGTLAIPSGATQSALILMTLTAGGMVFYFWRKGWIGRKR